MSGSIVSQPTSMWRLRPVSATSMPPATSSGSPRLRPMRLPVPAGMRPIGVEVPVSTCATERTVPSPPMAHTRSTPSARAARACPKPGSSRVVSLTIGSSHSPWARTVARTSLMGGRDVDELRRVEDDRDALLRRLRGVVLALPERRARGALRGGMTPLRPAPSRGHGHEETDDQEQSEDRHDHGPGVGHVRDRTPQSHPRTHDRPPRLR